MPPKLYAVSKSALLDALERAVKWLKAPKRSEVANGPLRRKMAEIHGTLRAIEDSEVSGRDWPRAQKMPRNGQRYF